MPGSPTTIYGLTVPTVGGDTNNWGGELNTDLATLDTIIGLPRTKRAALSGATPAITLADTGSNFYAITITVPATVSITNTPAGTFASQIILKMINGGAAVVTWPVSITWLGETGAVPVLKASGIDYIILWTNDNGTSWSGATLGSAAIQPPRYRCKVYNSGSQSIPDNTETILLWNQEAWDDGTLHDIASLTGRITIPSGGDGLYSVKGQIRWGGDSNSAPTPDCRLSIYQNGVLKAQGEMIPANSSRTSRPLQVVCDCKVVAADYLELKVIQVTGSAQIVNASEANSWFSAHRAQIT